MSELKTYRCLIVDDEVLAQELLESHVKKIREFHLVGKCLNALEAKQMLKNGDLDVMFLDIQMPEISGIDFLKTLDNPPLVVFTTAYSEYALEGYELNVVDYLLKPITFERFFQASSKVLDRLQAGTLEESDDSEAIYVKSEYKIVKVKFADIKYVEGMQKYVRFHLPNKRVMTLMSLTSLESVLPKNDFMRVHKSYIVNLSKIESIDGNMLQLTDGGEVTVSKTQKHELLQRLDQFGLL